MFTTEIDKRKLIGIYCGFIGVQNDTVIRLTRTSIHDVHLLKDVKELFSDCMIKDVLAGQHPIDLFETAGIELGDKPV